MKTKISTFIAIIFLSLVGTSTVLAQGAKASFKKDGVTVFESAISDIDSIVFKENETNYVDVDWSANTITSYDESAGAVKIQYQGVAPSFEENKAIVLPQEYGYDIRVIKGSTVSGNSVTLQTEQGNICHLFMDTNFTLSTDPSLSSLRSSGRGKIITPSEIGVMTEDGYVVIYKKDATLKSGAGYGDSFDIFSFGKDYSGEDLYNNGNHRVFWEKCKFDIGMKGVFYFDFGKKIENKIPLGDLKEFEFYLEGNLNVDLLLKYVFAAQIKENKENLIKKDILFGTGLPTQFTFMVGGVPVVVFVYVHLNNRYNLEANAEITMSAGCNIQANAKVGLNYKKEVGVSMINSFTPSFSLYAPTITAKGSLSAKGSLYPRVEFAIYKSLCPWIDLMPYLRTDFEAGMRASTDGNNYLAWTSKSYAGVDVRGGFKIDPGTIFLPLIDLWKSDIYNPFDKLLFDLPKKIELVSPVNGTKVIVGEPVNVSFYVSSFNNITQNYFSCIGGLVNFVTNGETDKTVTVSDLNGNVSVNWIPKNEGDVLIAKIMDKNGQTISEATFRPELEKECEECNNCDWVLINGVKWATRNVGASKPEDYGNYYQWNKGTTDFLLYEDYYNSSYPKSTSWLPANDPSPAGYRVPTSAEIQSLTNSTYVKWEWTTRNGVYGGRFTDRASGKCIFLPAAGSRNSFDGELYVVGSYGYCWSSTRGGHFDYYAYNLHFFNDGYAGGGWGDKSLGIPVRPVAK